jgi:hypothetical protein
MQGAAALDLVGHDAMSAPAPEPTAAARLISGGAALGGRPLVACPHEPEPAAPP